MKEIKIASPGRINLIGEHIDYNDGYVLPAAIDKYIYLTINVNGEDSQCIIKSQGFDNDLVVDLNNIAQGTNGWHNYVIGVVNEIQKLTKKLKGFDCNIVSEVPIGSGVSSSAALECGLAFGLNQLFNLNLDNWQLVKIGQEAEHNYVGTKCGIMDQFASVMGKEGHTMLLDCRSLDFEYVPTKIEPYRFLLLNTNIEHNLSTGEYNIRRAQCEEGLQLLSQRYNIDKSFRNVTFDMLEDSKSELGSILYRRCMYVVEETERVLKAVAALKENRLEYFGKLMCQTHHGLREKYEVSCAELDFLVKLSENEPQILGARMMGGGFGGCTLNLIHKDAIESFVEDTSKAYKNKFNIDLTYFQTVLSNGTSIIN